MNKFAAFFLGAVLGYNTTSSFAATIYTDEAEWQTAVSGATVGTYPLGVTRTDSVWEIDYRPATDPDGGGYSIVGNPAQIDGPWSDGGIQPSLYANFFYAGNYIDAACWDSACSTYSLGEVLINFDTPVIGLAGFGQIVAAVNGTYVDIEGGFFGVTDIGNSLDLYVGPNIDDGGLATWLDNIVVAYDMPSVDTPPPVSVTQPAAVDEPSGALPMAGGLFALAALQIRKAWRKMK